MRAPCENRKSGRPGASVVQMWCSTLRTNEQVSNAADQIDKGLFTLDLQALEPGIDATILFVDIKCILLCHCRVLDGIQDSISW